MVTEKKRPDVRPTFPVRSIRYSRAIMTTTSLAPAPIRPAKAPKVGIVSLGCPKALVDSERIIT
ncbi:MAG TPA: hypothetical protein DHV57_12095, partial [Hyphomonas sp.]|nr:hypothetical protein [Hyphomonas sp.]